MGGSTQQQTLGVGDQRAEVGHRAHAHEDKAGIDAQLDAQVQHVDEADADGDITEGDAVGDDILLRGGQSGDLIGQRTHGIHAAGGDLRHQLVESIRAEHVLERNHQGIRVGLQNVSGYAAGKHLGQELGRDGLAAEQIPVDVPSGEQDLVEHSRAGQVGHQHTKGDGNKQQWLELLYDAQKQQNARDDDHDGALPVIALEELIKAGARQKIDNSFHVKPSGVSRWCTAACQTPPQCPWLRTQR